jgi:hypothetical protein
MKMIADYVSGMMPLGALPWGAFLKGTARALWREHGSARVLQSDARGRPRIFGKFAGLTVRRLDDGSHPRGCAKTSAPIQLSRGGL